MNASLRGLLASVAIGMVWICGVTTAQAEPGGPSWTGFTIGFHGGYSWADVDFPGVPAYPVGPPRPELEGGFVGGQIGYNVQLDKLVVGVVADLSFANLEQTVRDGNYVTETANIDRFGTVRAVLGYSIGRFLPFGTIGYGWADMTYGATCPDPAAAPFGFCRFAGPRSYSSTETMSGLAYGGGLKYAIDDHFSLGFEYVRIDLDEKTFKAGPIAAIPQGSGKIESNLDIVKFQVDYKF